MYTLLVTAIFSTIIYLSILTMFFESVYAVFIKIFNKLALNSLRRQCGMQSAIRANICASQLVKKLANDPVASYHVASSYVVRELMTILGVRCSENLHCTLHNFPRRGINS